MKYPQLLEAHSHLSYHEVVLVGFGRVCSQNQTVFSVAFARRSIEQKGIRVKLCLASSACTY